MTTPQHTQPQLSLAPFDRFQGWRFIALVFVFSVYTFWFTGPGPFGQLAALAPETPLQAQGFYSGDFAVDVLSKLDSAGRKTKYLALIFDVPYMIMQALVFEAAITFSLLKMPKISAKTKLLYLFPIGFLLADVLENSLLALTLASDSVAIGTLAGYVTALKFTIFMPAIVVAISCLLIGAIVRIMMR